MGIKEESVARHFLSSLSPSYHRSPSVYFSEDKKNVFFSLTDKRIPVYFFFKKWRHSKKLGVLGTKCVCVCVCVEEREGGGCGGHTRRKKETALTVSADESFSPVLTSFAFLGEMCAYCTYHEHYLEPPRGHLHCL